jgi:hypothetical protein
MFDITFPLGLTGGWWLTVLWALGASALSTISPGRPFHDPQSLTPADLARVEVQPVPAVTAGS